MGCGEFLVKYILFFTNLVFALAGLALLGIGVAVQLKISVIVDLLDGYLEAVPVTSMIVGGIIFFIAFLGCCGAVRESNCMLVSYSIFMLVLMVAKIALAVVIFVKLDDLIKQVSVWITDVFNKNPTSFHEIESMFKCCGTTGPGSYAPSILSLPDSCCAAPPCNPLTSYPGCTATLEDFFQTFGLAIGILAITVVAVELVSVVFGLCLANHVRNKYRRARY